MNDKLATITNLFEGKKIRSIWDAEAEDYYFSVVDVVNALAEPANPRDYWYQLKKRLSEEEKSEVSTNCRQLKLKVKDFFEEETGSKVVTKSNSLNYQYIDEDKLIEK